MTLTTVRHIDFARLTSKQKGNLKKKLQQRKKIVQAQLNEVNKALGHVTQKSKRRPARRRGHR
jgi:hypothetical protein